MNFSISHFVYFSPIPLHQTVFHIEILLLGAFVMVISTYSALEDIMGPDTFVPPCFINVTSAHVWQLLKKSPSSWWLTLNYFHLFIFDFILHNFRNLLVISFLNAFCDCFIYNQKHYSFVSIMVVVIYIGLQKNYKKKCSFPHSNIVRSHGGRQVQQET